MLDLGVSILLLFSGSGLFHCYKYTSRFNCYLNHLIYELAQPRCARKEFILSGEERRRDGELCIVPRGSKKTKNKNTEQYLVLTSNEKHTYL